MADEIQEYANRRPARSWLVAFFTAMAVAAAFVFLLVRLSKGHEAPDLARMAVLASLAAPYVMLLVLGKEPAWKWLIVLFASAGLAVIAVLTPGGAAALFRPASWFVGLTWVGSGCITLYLYIRRTQPPAAEIE